MSMFDDVLGLGRTAPVNEAVEPELANDDFDSVESLDESVDPMEFILTAAFENKMNMVNIDNAIMCEEYSYLKEHGEEMVYEEVSISSIIQRAKNAVMSLWNKIQSFLKKAQEKFATKLDNAFLKKYEDKAKGKKGTINGYDDIFDIAGIKKNASELFKTMEDAATVVYTAATQDNPTFPDSEEVKTKYSESKKKMKSVFSDAKKNKQMITLSADEALSVFKSIGDAKKDIKMAYDESKKNINIQLKALKKMESVAKKAKVIPTKASANIHKSVKTVNTIGSLLAMTNRAYVRALNMAKAQAKAVIIAAAAKSVSSESAEVTTGGFLDSVEIL